jgi:predicted HNH restriction endonuclease
MKVNCKNCGKKFEKKHSEIKKTNNNFCSRSCSATYNNKKYPREKLKPWPETVQKYSACKKCGKQLNYKKRRMLCSLCKNTSNDNKTLAEVAYDKHHKSSCWALVRSRARAVMKHKPQICSKCGYDKHVEVAHIKSIKNFDLNTLISEVNDESNLILLCPNCHWEYDHQQ